MKPSSVRFLVLGSLIFFSACWKTEEAVQINYPDTTKFQITHNLDLSDKENERAIALKNDPKAVKALFARRFTYDFDYVARGQTSNMAEFYVYDLNPKDEVVISAVTVTGPNATDFLIVDKTDLPMPLKQSTFNIKMMFTPRSGGEKKATLLVVSQNHGAYRVELTGNSGNGPELSLALVQKDENIPLPNGFKTRLLASTAPLQPGQCEDSPQKLAYRVHNSGRSPLTVASGKVEGTHADLFRVDTAFPITLKPNEHRILTVEFPGGHAEGTYTGELILESNDANESSYHVPLATYTRGPAPCLQIAVTTKPNETPIFKPVVSKPNHAMGMVPVGSIANLTLHIKNAGFLPISFSPDKLAFVLQPNPAPVAMSLTFPPGGITLEAGQAIALPIGVAASETRQPFNAEVRFTLPEPVEPPVTLAASINGVVGTAQQTKPLDVVAIPAPLPVSVGPVSPPPKTDPRKAGH